MQINSAFSHVAPSPANGMSALEEKARELEGVFLNTLVLEMFKGLESDPALGGGGYGEETWRSMMAEQYANEIAQAGGIGLADQIVASLIETQEAAQAAQISRPMGAYYR